MMRHVILLRGETEAPALAWSNVLREAGVATMTARVAAMQLHETDGERELPLALLYEVTVGTSAAELHTVISRAVLMWSGVPLIACRRDTVSRPGLSSRRLNDSALRRLGFHAIADEPAQLPALLHDIEAQGIDDQTDTIEEEFGIPPSSLLLPERLSVQRLRAAFEVVASMHFATDQKSAASTALAGLAALVRADRWTIYLTSEMAIERDTSSLEPLAARGLTASERELPQGNWRQALMGNALALTGAESCAARMAVGTAETVKRKEGVRRVLAVPLVNGERVMGVLEAVREGVEARGFSGPESSLLSALAVPLTAALANSVRIAEAERLSQTDDLTKLHNARFLRQFLIGEVKRARRYGSPVTALFLDLDDFKRINDEHGHLVGSHVLMEMASVILASVRDTDVVARYGGDEFVVILPETGSEQAARVAERVREKIAEHAFTGGRGLRLHLTASFGVAGFPEHAQSPQQLIASADSAMYEAKAARKNCTRFAGVMSDS